MKAYCINLDRSADRLEHMTQQFDRLGITFERVAGVDGDHPDVAAEAAQALPTALGPRISAHAYACFQSHRKAWGQLVASGESYGLVLEDDLLLAEGFSDYLKEGWVPSDADLVRLETFRTRTHLDANPCYAVGLRQMFRLRSSHLGAGCYILSARVALRLLKQTEVVRDAVDEVLFSETSELFSDLVIYQMVPAPAVQAKRLRPEKTGEGWLASNILERFESDVPEHAIRAETSVQRLKRRLSETIRAVRRKTRYIVVPFG
jgi:glycosyl transferase, family 25